MQYSKYLLIFILGFFLPSHMVLAASGQSLSGAEFIGVSASPVINCLLRVDNPHKSTHVPGTINVVARLQCTAPVAKIEMRIGLARDGQEVSSTDFANSGNAALEGNTFAKCVSGVYEGASATIITFPSGSIPSSGALYSNSSRVTINCS